MRRVANEINRVRIIIGENMNPVAFEIFGISVRWYGILIATAILVGTKIATARSAKKGIDENQIIDLLLVAIPFAIIGARLYYVAFEWDNYAGNFMKIINIRSGGLAIHGGVLGAVLSGYIYTRFKKIDALKVLDLCAPSLILGQAIGRWGNYINGEAHGGPTDLPWAITVDGVKVHPTFLYESLWNFMVFWVLLWIDKKYKKFDGQIFLLYGILYSIARFFIEGMRTDSLMFFNLRIAQIVSLAIILIFTVIYIVAIRKNKEKLTNV